MILPSGTVKYHGMTTTLKLMMSWLQDTDLGDAHGLDVPDPIGTGVAQYTECYRLLSQAVDSLLRDLGRKL